MVKLKGIKSLGVKTRTWFFEHSKKQSIQMKIYQNLLYIRDQGILYQSPKYRNYLKKSSFTQSMSAKGNAYDNAVVESFFGTLKCETIYLQKVKSLSDLIRTIDEYIYWYNHERIKLTLGGYSSIQYRLMNQ